MTIINIGLKVPTPAGPVGAEGRVNFQRVDRLVDGSVVLLPARTSVALVAGVASVDLAAGVYWVDEVTPGGTAAYRNVPALGPVDYSTLVAIDPVTLDPTAAADPAWVAMARSTINSAQVTGDDLILTRTDGTTLDAGNVRGPVGPPINLTVGVVETGPDTPGTPGPAGPTGPAGAAGGLVLGTVIGAAVDLNTLTSPGLYRIENAPATGLNYPVIASGNLMVVARTTTTHIEQTYTPLWANNTWNGTTLYKRWALGGVWSAWRVFTSTRVDQTAGRVIYQWDDLNNREQLIYADTGWRELSTVLLNGWTASSVLMRRFNNLVSFKLYQLNPTAATSDIFYIPPVGFVRTHGAGVLLFPKDASTLAFLSSASSGLQFNPRGAANYGNSGFTEVQWTTTDAWPTTLPGTASGAVPNA